MKGDDIQIKLVSPERIRFHQRQYPTVSELIDGHQITEVVVKKAFFVAMGD